MIQVTVNGAAHRFEQPLNVRELLEKLEMAGKKIAVERNGEIVPKGVHCEVRWSQTATASRSWSR